MSLGTPENSAIQKLSIIIIIMWWTSICGIKMGFKKNKKCLYIYTSLWHTKRVARCCNTDFWPMVWDKLQAVVCNSIPPGGRCWKMMLGVWGLGQTASTLQLEHWCGHFATDQPYSETKCRWASWLLFPSVRESQTCCLCTKRNFTDNNALWWKNFFFLFHLSGWQIKK